MFDKKNEHAIRHDPLDSDRANRDPISGAPGAHPVGVGVGAAGGGAMGAAVGAIGGPVGAAIGAAAGAIAGGLAGKAVAEEVDPTVEDTYWRDNYLQRPYVVTGTDYSQYGPAYRYGWETAMAFHGREFDAVEAALEREWERRKMGSTLPWSQARDAVRDAWHRARRRAID